MDPITHTLAGVGTANAFFRQRGGSRAVLVLVAASLAPDVDALVHLSGDSTSVLMRRTFGHSLFMMPLWALLLTSFFRWLYPDLRFRFLYSIIILGMGLHLFLDLVNSFGVVPLWPFNDWRPELAIIFIIDLSLTGILLFPLILCLIKKAWPYLIMFSRISIACMFIYAIFCGLMRAQANNVLAEEIKRSGKQLDFSYVFPEPFGPHRWKGVTQEKGTYSLFLIHPLSNRLELKKEVQTNENHPLVKKIRGELLPRKLEWFFKAPVWTLKTKQNIHNKIQPETVEASVYDLRFVSLMLNRKTPFVYNFIVDTNGIVLKGS